MRFVEIAYANLAIWKNYPVKLRLADGVPHGFLQEAPTRTSRLRLPSLARRARTAHLRKHFRGRLEVVGRADEDDPQRVPADALAERGAAAGIETHGGFLLRRGGRPPARIRAASRKTVGAARERPTPRRPLRPLKSRD